MASFSQILPGVPLERWIERSRTAREDEAVAVLKNGRARSMEDFCALLSPAVAPHLEELAAQSQKLTRHFFGNTIRLFAPLYLSNECVNVCKYCGFSRHNAIPRITLPAAKVEDETRLLAARGFRSLLIVAGEHPKYVANGYVAECIRRCLPLTPQIALELGPLETAEYAPLVAAGAEGLVVYQETYHEPTYREMHTAGPKKNYAWRLDTAERGHAAGFRRLGIGALFGLHDWRYEAVALAAHARHLLKHCWNSYLTVALPRLRPAAGGFNVAPENVLGDRELVQLMTALRLLLPTAGLVLSTREPAKLRDGLCTLGVTHMSAGSSTEPGGYSHFDESQWTPTRAQPGEQFHIADERPPQVVAAMLRARGLDPVWKDHDLALTGPTLPASPFTVTATSSEEGPSRHAGRPYSLASPEPSTKN
jgi:2-iminoacetate synthase